MSQRHPRLGRSISNLLITAVMCAGSFLVTAAPASAATLDWDGLGKDCIESFNPSVGVVLTTTLAPNIDEAPDYWANAIAPSGDITSGPPVVVDFDVPDAFFEAERMDADGGPISGFYMVSVEFTQSCEDADPVPFTPCFTTSIGPDPWILDLGDLQLLFFFYADGNGDVSGPQNSVLEISDGSSGCSLEGPDGGPGGDLGDLLELIDEIGLEFASDLTRKPFLDFSLDPYLERVSEAAGGLPDTL